MASNHFTLRGMSALELANLNGIGQIFQQIDGSNETQAPESNPLLDGSKSRLRDALMHSLLEETHETQTSDSNPLTDDMKSRLKDALSRSMNEAGRSSASLRDVDTPTVAKVDIHTEECNTKNGYRIFVNKNGDRGIGFVPLEKPKNIRDLAAKRDRPGFRGKLISKNVFYQLAKSAVLLGPMAYRNFPSIMHHLATKRNDAYDDLGTPDSPDMNPDGPYVNGPRYDNTPKPKEPEVTHVHITQESLDGRSSP